MARLDRREKLALDEAYRYYRTVDKNGDYPDLYRLVKAFKTVTAALGVADHGHEFKLTRQLWRRIQQSMFDKLLTSFPGYVIVTGEDGQQLKPRDRFPEEGVVEFHPDGCRRADDIFQMEIKHLYPATLYRLQKTWETKGARIAPEDLAGGQCTEGGCFLKPVVLGEEVLSEESYSGREKAYHEWWDLYQQAYCTRDEREKAMIYRQMDELEAVWGNLYY